MLSRTYTYTIQMKSREGEVVEEVFREEAEAKRRLKELFETKFSGMRITASGKRLYYAKDESAYWTIHYLKIQDSVKRTQNKAFMKEKIEHPFSHDELSSLLVSTSDIPTTPIEMARIEAERKLIQRRFLEEDMEHVTRLAEIQLENPALVEAKQQAWQAEVKDANKRNIRRAQQVRREVTNAVAKWTLAATTSENPSESPQAVVSILTGQPTPEENLESELMLFKPIDRSQQRIDENLFYCISISFSDNRDDIVLKYDTYAEAEERLLAFRSQETEEPARLWRHVTSTPHPEVDTLEFEEEGITETETEVEQTTEVDATETEEKTVTEEEAASTASQLKMLLSRLMDKSTSVDVLQDVTYLSCGESGDVEIKLFVHPKWMLQRPFFRNGLGRLGRMVIENNEGVVIGNYLFNNYLTAQAYLMSGLGDTFEKIRLIRTSTNQWYLGEDVAETSVRKYMSDKLWRYRIYLVPRQ